MNHTNLAIVAVLAAAALVAGVFATGIQAAHADSVSFKQSIKQKSKCLAVVIGLLNCNNVAANAFLNIGP